MEALSAQRCCEDFDYAILRSSIAQTYLNKASGKRGVCSGLIQPYVPGNFVKYFDNEKFSFDKQGMNYREVFFADVAKHLPITRTCFNQI
ncbi:hypothetical protein MIR68_005018 [Amoeboaphelidium protococcarum]|nr:hypothetical protein MIR68_005018 [Amoeboaphelidium protococcarum]